jgi:IS30 family transposase
MTVWAHVTEAATLDKRPKETDDKKVLGHWESQCLCQPAIGTAGTGSM